MLKLEKFALTDQGRKRDHNEDYLGDQLVQEPDSFDPKLLEERGYLFAVADGMGGHAAGEVASKMAITTLFEQYYNTPSSGSPVADLDRAVSMTNLEVHNAGTDGGRGQMGTTLTLALLKGNRAVVGNVGDSRTYLIRQGIPLRVTRDHSLVQDQIDMGALTPEQAEHSLIRNVITRAIGHRPDVDTDFFEQEVQPGDVLLLCSDGLHGQVKETEMGAIVASTPSLKEAAQQLINLANERGGPDNISVFLVRILEPGEAIPPFLNGHVNKGYVMQQATVQSRPASSAADGSATDTMVTSKIATGKAVGEKTDRYHPIPVKGSAIENQTTLPRLQTVNATIAEPKESHAGGIIIIVALLVIIIGGVVFFIINNNSTPPAATVTPSAAPTTPAPAIPTVTPKLAPANPAPPIHNNGGAENSVPTPVVPNSAPTPTNTSGQIGNNAGEFGPDGSQIVADGVMNDSSNVTKVYPDGGMNDNSNVTKVYPDNQPPTYG